MFPLPFLLRSRLTAPIHTSLIIFQDDVFTNASHSYFSIDSIDQSRLVANGRGNGGRRKRWPTAIDAQVAAAPSLSPHATAAHSAPVGTPPFGGEAKGRLRPIGTVPSLPRPPMRGAAALRPARRRSGSNRRPTALATATNASQRGALDAWLLGTRRP